MIIWVESLILPENISFDMKKINLLFFLLLVAGVAFQGCSRKYKTYAERLEDEREAIKLFISRQDINVISFDQFIAQDSTTNVSRNEYVLLESNGVYMQIINQGEGKKAETGDQILVRFNEMDVASGDTILSSYFPTYQFPYNPAQYVDEFRYTKTTSSSSGTFVAETANSYGVMGLTYGTAVPEGWLYPLNYIKLGRNTASIAKVRLIVPFQKGPQYLNSQNAYLTLYYELTYQLSR